MSFYKNKISGAVAEAAARSHFEMLGYDVDAYGIEHAAPLYLRNRQQFLKQGSGSFQMGAEHKRPDFIVSRANPVHQNACDAITVEAKFRVNPDLEAFRLELLENYAATIEEHKEWMLFYLVARGYSRFQASANYQGKDSDEVAVFLMHAQFKKWVKVGDSRFDDWPLYLPSQGRKTFNAIYQEEVLPALTDMFG